MEPLDAPLFKTFQTLPAFPFANLVRQNRAAARVARDAFIADRATPSFVYHRLDRFDDVAYLVALRSVHDRIASIPASEDIRALYLEKLTELTTRAQIIAAMKRKDDAAVSALADHLFGPCVQTSAELADEFTALLARSHELHTHQDRVNAITFERMVRATLDHYGMTDWTTRFINRPSVSVSRGDSLDRAPTVKIPKHFLASRARAARLLTHEIEVHALRTTNGTTSPILLLGRGLAGYIATDEGLAVAMQQKLKTEESMDPGFWDAWAAALSKEEDFQSCFETIRDARRQLNIALKIENPDGEAFDTAWRLMLRVSRGIHRPNAKGLGFRRDHLYRSGLVQVRQAIDTFGESEILPTLFAGHASVAHIPLLRSKHIVGRTPDFVSKAIVKDVLQSERQKRSPHL